MVGPLLEHIALVPPRQRLNDGVSTRAEKAVGPAKPVDDRASHRRATADGAAPEAAGGASGPESPQRSAPPGPLAALFAHVVWPNWTAALLLVATMWMPHFTGCNGEPIRPVEMWSQVDDSEEWFDAAVFSWPYLWAGAFGVTLVAIALVRPLRPELLLLSEAAGVYLLILSGFVIAVAITLFRWLTTRSPDPDGAWIWAWAPAVIAPGVWAAVPLRRGDLFSAWARLTTALVLFAVPTILVLGAFAQESRYGFNLAMLACAALLPACWALRWRGRRALVDPAAPAEPVRFRIAHLVMWVTAVAVICGYYRFLALAS